jgi:hypothetical protein
MNRLSLIFRSLAVAVALIFVVVVAGSPIRGGGTAAPVAWGCNGPQVGAPVGAFYDCDECIYYGQEGASLGQWYSWRCRLQPDGLYYLYVT